MAAITESSASLKFSRERVWSLGPTAVMSSSRALDDVGCRKRRERCSRCLSLQRALRPASPRRKIFLIFNRLRLQHLLTRCVTTPSSIEESSHASFSDSSCSPLWLKNFFHCSLETRFAASSCTFFSGTLRSRM